jgi:phospholipase C
MLRAPRRYTVEAGKELSDSWAAVVEDNGQFDLWVLGPNGFHGPFQGNVSAVASGLDPEVRV